jgi:hypothetical protein
MSARYFIAKTVQSDQYVVLLENKVVAGPFGHSGRGCQGNGIIAAYGRWLLVQRHPIVNDDGDEIRRAFSSD